MPETHSADRLAAKIRDQINGGLDVLKLFVDVFDGKPKDSTVATRVMAADNITQLAFSASQEGLGPNLHPLQLAMLNSRQLFQSAVRYQVEVVEGIHPGTDTRLRILLANHLRNLLKVIDHRFKPDEFVSIFRAETRGGQAMEDFLKSVVDGGRYNVAPDDFFNTLQLLAETDDHRD